MSDVARRLRTAARGVPRVIAGLLREAADEIDRLGNLVIELNGVILQLNDRLEAAEDAAGDDDE